MCGVIYCKRADISQSAQKLVMKRYNKQSTRGTEGFGYVEVKNGYVVAEVRTQTETEILSKLEKSTADEILFHHRFPTSTPNIIESTHPIKVSHEKLKYNYYVIHNGVIRNDEELRTQHMQSGYTYTTDITKKWITRENTYKQSMWNDSESVAIDFVEMIEYGTEMLAEGASALIALQYEKTTGKTVALYYGRNTGNPLCVEKDKNFFSISSESGNSLKADTLYKLDYQTAKRTATPKSIGIYTAYKSLYSGSGLDWIDYRTETLDDEDDFSIDLHQKIEQLKAELKKANHESDYDLAVEIEIELDILVDEMNSKRGILY